MNKSIKLVIFDLAGTTVDFGCFAPVAPVMEAFASRGVTLTPGEARGPAGLDQLDRLRAVSQAPGVAQRWKATHGRDCTDDDLEDMLNRVVSPRRLASLEHHSRLIPGVIECMEYLKAKGIKTASTTGQFGDEEERVCDLARVQGFEPDMSLHPTLQVPGRPAPWLIFRAMERLRVYPPSAVVKIGDTAADIHEGRNAGVWAVGVLNSSWEVGLPAAQLADMTPEQQDAAVRRARSRLLDAGAHEVIPTVADVPWLITELEMRLRRGARP